MFAIAGSVLVLLVAAGALYQFVGSRRSARKFPTPGTIVEIAWQRLHLVCAGHGGPAVVFESGIAASSLSWSRVLRDVAAFTRACAYDRAGLGWSDPSQASRTVERMLAE